MKALMRRPLSLGLRLSLFFGVAAAIVFPIFGWVISHSTEKHFEEEDTAELTIIADAIEEALAGVHTAGDVAPIEKRFSDILIGHHSASLYIAGDNGRKVYTSNRTPDLSPIEHAAVGEFDDGAVHRWDDAEHSYRVLVRHVRRDLLPAGGSYAIVVAVPIDYHLRFLASFRRTLWLMIASSIALMSIMGWLAVRQGHAPLRDIVRRMRGVGASELTNRIPPETVPSELSDLAVSFNEMLRRVDEAFQRLSHFNADIAHELRTPITNLMTQTQVALSRARSPEEYREILYSNMEEYERMGQMVNDMLFLAQADSGARPTHAVAIDVAAEIDALFAYYESWADERGVSLKREGTAAIAGDRLMLQRALGNLISNAIRHTSPGGTVRVEIAEPNEGRVAIVVENPGTPIPPEHLPRLFDRFYRVDASRQRKGEGAGLGLAIAKSVVDAHGGSIEARSTGGRTRFRITMPKSPAEAAAA
jgi:two-component system, OmpR family, heavy metal sensor histidine kinase CusS